MEDQYNIFDLGFNKYLSKELSVLGIGQNDLSMPSIMGSSFLEIPPSQMGSGELVGNITMVAGLLQSYNFVTGSAGWQINYDGDVEFNSGVFRGSLVAGSIHIPDQNTTANSFHTDSDGNSWWGCIETDFTSDNDNANAYILKTGVVKLQSADITGAITISSGSGIANLTDAGSLAVLDAIGASNCNSTIISGGKIITGLLTASNIETGTLTVGAGGITVDGTITAVMFQTALPAAGHRVSLDPTFQTLNLYNIDGDSMGVFDGVADGLNIRFSATDRVYWSSGVGYESFEIKETVIKSRDIVPYSASEDLGATGNTWNKLWVDEIYLNGTARTSWPTSGVTAHGDLTGVTASQHHTKYLDSEARSAVTGTALPGNLVLGNHEINDVSYLKFDASYGRIYVGGTEIVDFISTTRVEANKKLMVKEQVQVDQDAWETNTYSLLVSNNSSGANTGKGYADYWAVYSEYTEIEKIDSKYLQLSEEKAKILILDNVVKEAKAKMEATKKDRGRFICSTKIERDKALKKYEERILNKDWTNRVNLAYEQKRFSILEQGTIMAFSDNGAIPTSDKGQTNIMGVVSTSPCFTAYAEDDGIQITKFGHTFVKVKGKCIAGNLLWTSSEEGCLEKAINPSAGQIVGRARETKATEGVEIIPVDLTL